MRHLIAVTIATLCLAGTPASGAVVLDESGTTTSSDFQFQLSGKNKQTYKIVADFEILPVTSSYEYSALLAYYRYVNGEFSDSNDKFTGGVGGISDPTNSIFVISDIATKTITEFNGNRIVTNYIIDNLYNYVTFNFSEPSGVDYNIKISAIPEPETWALMLVGMLGSGFMLRNSTFVQNGRALKQE